MQSQATKSDHLEQRITELEQTVKALTNDLDALIVDFAAVIHANNLTRGNEDGEVYMIQRRS